MQRFAHPAAVGLVVVFEWGSWASAAPSTTERSGTRASALHFDGSAADVQTPVVRNPIDMSCSVWFTPDNVEGTHSSVVSDNVYIYQQARAPSEVSTFYSGTPETSTALVLTTGLLGLGAHRSPRRREPGDSWSSS